MLVTVNNTRVNCTECPQWKKPYTAGSVEVAQQIAKHHRESRGHRSRNG